MGLFSRSLKRNVRWTFGTGSRIFSAPIVADINGDGIIEIVFGSDDNQLYAVRGTDGSLAWRFETDGPVRSAPSLADINEDGIAEIVFGSDDSNIYTLAGIDGRVIWTHHCDGPIRSAPALGDLDCSGVIKVLISGDDSTVYAINGRTGDLAWESSHKGSRSKTMVNSAACLVDLDGDGRMEILTGSAQNYILIFSPEGNLTTRRDIEVSSFNTPLAAGDINGDGDVEIVAFSDNGSLHVLDSDSETLWSKIVGISAYSAPILSDLNRDGDLEILVFAGEGPGDRGKLICLGARGDVLWEKALKGGIGANIAAVDLDEDGEIEVCIPTSEGILILDPRGEEKEIVTASGGITAGLSIADVNGDGKLEFVYGSADGKLVCVGSQLNSRPNQILVSGTRSDLRNTGVFQTPVQAIENLRKYANTLKSMGGSPGISHQKLLKAEREQGSRDIDRDLEEVRHALICEKAKMNRQMERGKRLDEIKSRLKVFSSLDIDGASQLSIMVGKIERLFARGENAKSELEAAEDLVKILEEKSKEKVRAVNAKRLSFLVGQFVAQFPEPTDQDIEGFIRYLQSEQLPFIPYEIRKAIDHRKHELKFQNLRDSGRFDFMSEEEKVITIGSNLAGSIIDDIINTMGISTLKIQRRMDEVSDDYNNLPKLVIAEGGKILTDELRKYLREVPSQKFIPTAISLFSIYITKLFDFYQELTDFETSYSRFKSHLEYLSKSFGAEEIIRGFQEKACHGIFAEEVRVKRILDL